MKNNKMKIGVTSTPLKREESKPLDFTGIALEQNNNHTMSNLQMLLKDNLGGTNRKYTAKQVLNLLDNPKANSRRLVDASRYLSVSSSYYMRLMLYMSRMLTLDHMVAHSHIDVQFILKSKEEFKKEYMEAVEYVESFNVKHEFGKILYTMVVEDVFFGYERRSKRNGVQKVTIQKFPMEYCKITGIKDGLFTFSYDMGYFGYETEKLKEFPREFVGMYRKYLETGEVWQPVNPEKGICFKFREDLEYIFPPFAAMIPDVLDYQEIKDLLKSKNKLENFKLLLQRIPFRKDARSEKDYLINLKSVEMFHNNIKSVLPDEIGLITSPMDIEEFSFEKKNNSLSTMAQEGREEIFDSAGMPSGLFSTGGSKSAGAVALIKAIQTDEAIMFNVLRQFERFFNNRLSSKFKEYSFQVMFPDLTVYNQEDKSDQYLQLAQYGVANKSLVAASIGLSTTQLMGMSILENEILGMDELLKPLQSSHTSSGKESGGQEKSINKLSDKGAETRDLGTNIVRNETQ